MGGRSIADAASALASVRKLKSLGYDVFPLKRFDAIREFDGRKVGKTPRDKGWQVEDYSSFDWRWWLTEGGNIGVRLHDLDTIIDVDMGHKDGANGKESLQKLFADLGWKPPSDNLSVLTGSGGMHIYTRLPEPLTRAWIQVDAYPGIDFKRVGGFVVAPGSIHPDTLQTYRWRSAGTAISALPPALVDILRRPSTHARSGDGGEISCEDLERLLAVLDPKEFRSYEKWIAISAAAFDATNGNGFPEWAEWCHRDPDYAGEDDDQLLHHWDSFEAGRAGGATYRTILKAVVDAGHKELVATLGAELRNPADDFADDEWEEVSLD